MAVVSPMTSMGASMAVMGTTKLELAPSSERFRYFSPLSTM